MRLAIAIGVLALIVGGAFIFMYSGIYNIAATEPHFPVTRWILETTMKNSVKQHAEDIVIPGDFQNRDMAQAWIQFQGMCLVCHGAPGRERSAIGKGMLPEPPSLSEEAPEWTPGELFWITKYGLKMAGMPAFGPTHDDQTLWTITSFVNELPNLTPKELQELRK